MKTIQKVFIFFMALALGNVSTYPNSFGRFFTSIATTTSYALRTRTSPTAHIKLYNSLQSLSAYKGMVAPSVYPLQQLLNCYSAHIAHQKIYNIVLGVLSKNPEKLNLMINNQVARNALKNENAIKNGLHHAKRWAQKFAQITPTHTAHTLTIQPSSMNIHAPIVTPPSTLGTLTSYFKKAPEPTLAQKVYYLAFHQGQITPSLAPLKVVIEHIKNLIPDPIIYKKCIIALCGEHKALFQELIDAQAKNKLATKMVRNALEIIQNTHVPVFTNPSLWSRFISYFKKSPEPTLAQKVYFLAYKNGPISPTEYPLKRITEQLKKQIPDPELYKQCIISLCTEHKPLLQKLINTQMQQQQYILEEKVRKGLEHSKHWLRRYNEGMEDIAASQALLPETTALTTTLTIPTAQKVTSTITAHQSVVPNTHIIHPDMIEIIPAPHPLAPSNALKKQFDYEIYLPDAHTASQTLSKNNYCLPSSSKVLSISATPTTPLHTIEQALNSEINQAQQLAQYVKPTVSFAQAQQALNSEITQAQHLAQYAPTTIPVATETKLLTASPTKLIAENKRPTVSFTQAQQAINNEINQAQQLTKCVKTTTTPVATETKLLTASPTKLIAENKRPTVSFAQAQQAINNEINQAQHLAQYAPITTPVATETKLLTASPTKLIAQNKQPTVSFTQAQQALNSEINQAQQLTKCVKTTTTPVATETKLLTALPTKLIAQNKQPAVSFAQAQQALNSEITQAQQLTQHAPSTANSSIATETKLLTASPTKLIAQNKQPAVSFAQAQQALNSEITQAQQLTKCVKATTTPVATETKLLTASPTKLIAENKQSSLHHDKINPNDIEIIPTLNKLENYKTPSKAYDYELDLPDHSVTHHAPNKAITGQQTVKEKRSSDNQYQQAAHASNKHDRQQSTSYKSYAAAAFGGLAAYAWYQQEEPTSIMPQTMKPTKWVTILGAIGASGIMMYKIICGTTKHEEKPTDPENTESIINNEHKSLIEQNETIEETPIDKSTLTPFDLFVLHHQPLGINFQFVHQMQQSGYSTADVQASTVLSEDQKANIINLVHQLRHTH